MFNSKLRHHDEMHQMCGGASHFSEKSPFGKCDMLLMVEKSDHQWRLVENIPLFTTVFYIHPSWLFGI